jgi:hypothetical protein
MPTASRKPAVLVMRPHHNFDETMASHIDHSKYPQLYPNMHAGNYLKTSSIRFGSIQFDGNALLEKRFMVTPRIFYGAG